MKKSSIMLAVVCLLGVASAKNVSPLRPSSSPGRSLRGRVLWSARTDTVSSDTVGPVALGDFCKPFYIRYFCQADLMCSNNQCVPTLEALAKQKAEQELQAAHQKEAAELHAAELAKKEADDLEAKKDAEELKRAEEAQQKAAIAAGVAKEKAEAAAEAAEEQRLADEKSLAEEKRAQLVALKAKKEAADAARVAAEAAEKAKAAADKKSDAEELKRAEEAQQKAAIAAGVAKEKAEAAAEAAEEQRLADEKSLAEEKRAQLVALKAKKEAADAARVAAEAAEKAKAAADKKSAFDATSSYHTDYHYNEWYKAQYTAIGSVSNYCKTHPTWGNLLQPDACGRARTRANNAWTSYVNNIALRKIRITSYCAKYEPDNASGCEARL